MTNWECVCTVGAFEQVAGANGFPTCGDVDECAKGLCPGPCTNTVGSYVCDSSVDPYGVCATGAHKCGPYGLTCIVNADKDSFPSNIEQSFVRLCYFYVCAYSYAVTCESVKTPK